MKKFASVVPLLCLLGTPAWATEFCSINQVQILHAGDGDVGCGIGNDAIEISGSGLFSGDIRLGEADLTVCGQPPGSVLVMCPAGDCETITGDYKLSIWPYWNWWNAPLCSYDLTVGPPGGGAPTGLTGLERITATFSSAGDTDHRLVHVADCTEGKVPIGGGYDINPNSVDGQVIVMESGPYGGGPGVGWRVRADGRPAGTTVWELVINVFCVDNPSNP